MPKNETLVTNLYYRSSYRGSANLLINDTSYIPIYTPSFSNAFDGTAMPNMNDTRPGGIYQILMRSSLDYGVGPRRVYFSVTGAWERYAFNVYRENGELEIIGSAGYIDLTPNDNSFYLKVLPTFGPTGGTYNCVISFWHDEARTQPFISNHQVIVYTKPIYGTILVNPLRGVGYPASLQTLSNIFGGEDWYMRLDMNAGFGRGGWLSYTLTAGGINGFDSSNPWISDVSIPPGMNGYGRLTLDQNGTCVITGKAKVNTVNQIPTAVLQANVGEYNGRNLINNRQYGPLRGVTRNQNGNNNWFGNDLAWVPPTLAPTLVVMPTVGTIPVKYSHSSINREDNYGVTFYPISSVTNSRVNLITSGQLGAIALDSRNFQRIEDRAQTGPLLSILRKQTTNKMIINGGTTYYVDVHISELATPLAEYWLGKPITTWNETAVCTVACGEHYGTGTWADDTTDPFVRRFFLDAVPTPYASGVNGLGLAEYTHINLMMLAYQDKPGGRWDLTNPPAPKPYIVAAGWTYGVVVNGDASWEIIQSNDPNINFADGTYHVVWSGRRGSLGGGTGNGTSNPATLAVAARPVFQNNRIALVALSWNSSYPHICDWMLVRYPT